MRHIWGEGGKKAFGEGEGGGEGDEGVISRGRLIGRIGLSDGVCFVSGAF
jgi:hypothetical protein